MFSLFSERHNSFITRDAQVEELAEAVHVVPTQIRVLDLKLHLQPRQVDADIRHRPVLLLRQCQRLTFGQSLRVRRAGVRGLEHLAHAVVGVRLRRRL
eukprot:769046-Pyramimonas_sp.AAC.1